MTPAAAVARSRSLAGAFLAAVLLLASLGLPVAPAKAQTLPSGVLVQRGPQGSPPLTQQTVDSVTNFLEWVLDAPFTGAQRQEIKDTLVAEWQDADPATLETIAQIISFQGELAKAGESQRLAARQTLQPILLSSAREDVDDPFSGVLLSAYEAAHTPIAAGNPPLTRQVSDAYAETMLFMLQVVSTGDVWTVDKAVDASLKNGFAQELSAGYAGLEAPQQQILAQMPVLRAALREAWPALSAAERGQLRDQWRPIVQGMLSPLDCESFVALAGSNFVEGTQDNATRLRGCWNDHPQLAPPEYRPAQPAQPAQQAQAQPAQPAQQNAVQAQAQQNAAYLKAQQGLMNSHNTYIHMSNVLTQNHASNMNAILTMGGSNYRYEVKYR
jgi:hypothetical protein